MRTIWVICLLVIWCGCRKEEKPSINLPAVVITLSISDVSTTTATCWGDVATDGGSYIVSRGFVWHTDSIPNLENMIGYSNDGTGSGVFSSIINYLSHNTEYFVRAYATNSSGTYYGKVLSFRTSKRVGMINLRYAALIDYNNNYIGSIVNDPGWTGNVIGCIAGTLSADSKEKTLQRLNYFRRLVGLSDNVSENYSQHQGCQEAALIFKASNNLSQYPPQHWTCWTQAGYNAANGSNISWGVNTSGEFTAHTTNSISLFIQDPGSHNKAIIHRSWLFMPGLTKLGIGSTNKTSCMQWKDNISNSGQIPEFIAYPPAGYIPNQITYPKWSFTLPGGANFTNAKVSMTDSNGISISLNVINKPNYPAGSLPLQHLVWEPNITPAGFTSDNKFTVNITDITGAPQNSYTYDVIVIPVASGY